MATFNKPTTKPRVSSPVSTTGGTAPTFEGAAGYRRTPLSDLYLLSVSNLVSADTFYEKVDQRNERYIDLLREVALAEQAHVVRMLPWLRQDGYMRSASVLGAAEAAKTLCDEHRYDGVEDMVDGVLQRADEPGEFLAYWFSIAGKAWPKRYQPVKKGLKKAVQRLYTEFSYNKWDSAKRAYRFADILNIVHPAPKDARQNDLFHYILSVRYDNDPKRIYDLPMRGSLAAWRGTAATHPANPELLDPQFIKNAGLTWEDVLSELGGKVDKKVLWEAVIPAMAPGALLRNLRNFDEVGISDTAVDLVATVLSNGERVRKAKLFPYRFLAAYRAAPSLRWGHALERGLAGSLELVPTLRGRTLILVDRSPSMFPNMQGSTPNRSDVTLADQAAVFGAALAVKAEDATLVEFGGTTGQLWGGRSRNGDIGSRRISVPRGASVLKVVDSFGDPIPGTDIPRAVKDNFTSEYSRVVIVTDEQSRPGMLPSNMSSYGGMRETAIDDLIPKNVPVYLWNMQGYSSSILDASGPNRHSFGGLSDSSFSLIQLLESGRNAPWPWLA